MIFSTTEKRSRTPPKRGCFWASRFGYGLRHSYQSLPGGNALKTSEIVDRHPVLIQEQRTLSVADFKPIIAGDRQLNRQNLFHSSARWSLLAPGSEFGNGVGQTFHLNFNAAISAIANPAPQSEIECSSAASSAETHTLHPSMDDQLPTFHEGLRPGLTAIHETSVVAFGPVASASRHREQIVVQLAQWR